MKTNGPVDFTAAPEQAAQRHVRFDRILVDFSQLQENLDSFVRLFVQEVIETLEVLITEQLAALV